MSNKIAAHSTSQRGRPGLWLRVSSAVVAGLLRALGRSWRISFEGPDPFSDSAERRVVGAIWHRNLFIAAVLFCRRGFAVPVSRSRDGERIALVLRRMGFPSTPRGSSSRGGTAALRSTLREVRAGSSAAVLTDGPRGPARRSKDGVVALARLSGVPITPASFSAKPCLRVGSWDGSLIPLPFARVVCRYAPPIAVARDLAPADEPALLERLDRVLNRDTDELDAKLGLREAAKRA